MRRIGTWMVALCWVAASFAAAAEPNEAKPSIQEMAREQGWSPEQIKQMESDMGGMVRETGEGEEAFKIVRAGLRNGLNAQEIGALLEDVKLAQADGATLHEMRHVVKKALKEGGLPTAKEALASYRALVAEGVDPHEARKSVERAFKGKDKDDDGDDDEKDKPKIGRDRRKHEGKEGERGEKLRERSEKEREKLREKGHERAGEIREEGEKRLEEKRLEREGRGEREREEKREEKREERRDRDEGGDENRPDSSGKN